MRLLLCLLSTLSMWLKRIKHSIEYLYVKIRTLQIRFGQIFLHFTVIPFHNQESWYIMKGLIKTSHVVVLCDLVQLQTTAILGDHGHGSVYEL